MRITGNALMGLLTRIRALMSIVNFTLITGVTLTIIIRRVLMRNFNRVNYLLGANLLRNGVCLSIEAGSSSMTLRLIAHISMLRSLILMRRA